MNTVTVTSDYGIAPGVDVVFANLLVNGFFVFLPDPAAWPGRQITVRRIDQNPNLNRAVNVKGKLDGVTQRLLFPEGALTVVSNGAAWFTIYATEAPQFGRLFVSQRRGDDLNDGRADARPKKTIGAAVALTGGSSEIVIDSGIYVEALDLRSKIRLRLRGTGPSGLNTGVTIKAPSDTADVVRLGTVCELHDVTLTGSKTFTGRLCVIDHVGSCVVRNVGFTNPDGTIVSPGATGVWDPVVGGTGLYIVNSENCLIDNVGFQELRVGLHILSAGHGNSMHAFRKAVISRCWQEVLIQQPAGTLSFHGVKAVNPQMNGDSGFSWDVDCAHSIFTACEWTEGGSGRKARFVGSDNAFVVCENSPQCKTYIEGDRNKLLNFYAQNKVFLNGDWNEVDGIYKTASGAIEVNGTDNSIRRRAPTVAITDNGLRTRIDT